MPPTRREAANELVNGCGYLLVLVLAVPILVIAVVAYFLGIGQIARFGTEGLQRAFEAPIVRVAFGMTMIVLAGWGSLRIFRRRALPEVTALAVVLWAITAFVLVSLGVIALASVITNDAGAPGF